MFTGLTVIVWRMCIFGNGEHPQFFCVTFFDPSIRQYGTTAIHVWSHVDQQKCHDDSYRIPL